MSPPYSFLLYYISFKYENGKSIAIYKEKNKIHKVYNKCPHLGCSLIFNEEEKTWDCPCHSSRFDIDGNCIKGPSNYDISYKKLRNIKKSLYYKDFLFINKWRPQKDSNL